MAGSGMFIAPLPVRGPAGSGFPCAPFIAVRLGFCTLTVPRSYSVGGVITLAPT
jgi:hypothetical protein